MHAASIILYPASGVGAQSITSTTPLKESNSEEIKVTAKTPVNTSSISVALTPTSIITSCVTQSLPVQAPAMTYIISSLPSTTMTPILNYAIPFVGSHPLLPRPTINQKLPLYRVRREIVVKEKKKRASRRKKVPIAVASTESKTKTCENVDKEATNAAPIVVDCNEDDTEVDKSAKTQTLSDENSKVDTLTSNSIQNTDSEYIREVPEIGLQSLCNPADTHEDLEVAQIVEIPMENSAPDAANVEESLETGTSYSSPAGADFKKSGVENLPDPSVSVSTVMEEIRPKSALCVENPSPPIKQSSHCTAEELSDKLSNSEISHNRSIDDANVADAGAAVSENADKPTFQQLTSIRLETSSTGVNTCITSHEKFSEKETETISQPELPSSLPSPEMEKDELMTGDKISECIVRSMDLIDAPEGELMELGTDWVDSTNSPKSPISPTQMFLSMFPLLPRESVVAPLTENNAGLNVKAMAYASSSRSSFFIDAMLPDEPHRSETETMVQSSEANLRYVSSVSTLSSVSYTPVTATCNTTSASNMIIPASLPTSSIPTYKSMDLSSASHREPNCLEDNNYMNHFSPFISSQTSGPLNNLMDLGLHNRNIDSSNNISNFAKSLACLEFPAFDHSGFDLPQSHPRSSGNPSSSSTFCNNTAYNKKQSGSSDIVHSANVSSSHNPVQLFRPIFSPAVDTHLPYPLTSSNSLWEPHHSHETTPSFFTQPVYGSNACSTVPSSSENIMSQQRHTNFHVQNFATEPHKSPREPNSQVVFKQKSNSSKVQIHSLQQVGTSYNNFPTENDEIKSSYVQSTRTQHHTKADKFAISNQSNVLPSHTSVHPPNALSQLRHRTGNDSKTSSVGNHSKPTSNRCHVSLTSTLGRNNPTNSTSCQQPHQSSSSNISKESSYAHLPTVYSQSVSMSRPEGRAQKTSRTPNAHSYSTLPQTIQPSPKQEHVTRRASSKNKVENIHRPIQFPVSCNQKAPPVVPSNHMVQPPRNTFNLAPIDLDSWNLNDRPGSIHILEPPRAINSSERPTLFSNTSETSHYPIIPYNNSTLPTPCYDNSEQQSEMPHTRIGESTFHFDSNQHSNNPIMSKNFQPNFGTKAKSSVNYPVEQQPPQGSVRKSQNSSTAVKSHKESTLTQRGNAGPLLPATGHVPVNWMTDPSFKKPPASNPFSVSKLVDNSGAGSNGTGDRNELRTRNANKAPSKLCNPNRRVETTSKANYCAESLIRKNPHEWQRNDNGHNPRPAQNFHPYHVQNVHNSQQDLPTHAYNLHQCSQTAHHSSTPAVMNQNTNGARQTHFSQQQNIQQYLPQLQHSGNCQSHSHPDFQNHQSHSSSVSNFYLSTIFPEINDKRAMNPNSSNNICMSSLNSRQNANTGDNFFPQMSSNPNEK